MKIKYILALAVPFIPAWAHAEDLTILVAPRDSAAADYAQNSGLPNERRLHKAFMQATDYINKCGSCTTTIKIAGGDYTGKANVGLWTVPKISAPKANFRILGGWSDDFSSRDPFNNPSILRSTANRSSVVLKFDGRKHGVKQLVLSGLTFDTSPSNNYDAETNSLTKSGSSTFGHLAFGYISADELILSDNIFMNAPHMLGGPIVKPYGSSGRVIVENNMFFNNVVPWTVASGSYNNPPKDYIIRGNSFVLNWPYNPDATTSNPGALEIGNSRAAGLLTIENNLFAYNYGGAIFPQWDESRGPKLEIKNNLFYANGGLFGASSTDSGAVVGKFAGAATYSSFSASEIEDDFSWRVSGNVSFDPELVLGVPETKSLTSTGERDEGRKKWQADQQDISRNDDAKDDGIAVGETVDGQEDMVESVGDELAELEAMLDSVDLELSDDSKGEDQSASADLEGLDLELDLDFEDYAEDGVGLSDTDIKNYAPKVEFVPSALPFPGNGDAEKYGASPSRILKF